MFFGHCFHHHNQNYPHNCHCKEETKLLNDYTLVNETKVVVMVLWMTPSPNTCFGNIFYICSLFFVLRTPFSRDCYIYHSIPRPRRRQVIGAPQQGSPPPVVWEGEAVGSTRPPLQPLKNLPPASDGRQLLLHVGRPATMLSFASLNTGGPPPSLPPRPPLPPPLALQTVLILMLRRLDLLMDPKYEVEFNSKPLNTRIAVLSTEVGVENYPSMAMSTIYSPNFWNQIYCQCKTWKCHTS